MSFHKRPVLIAAPKYQQTILGMRSISGTCAVCAFCIASRAKYNYTVDQIWTPGQRLTPMA